METMKMYIDGAFRESSNHEWSKVTNPANEEVVGQVPKGTQEDVDLAVAAAKAALPAWSSIEPKERKAYLEKVLAGIRAQGDYLAELISMEFGAAITFAQKAHIPLSINELKTTLAEFDQYEFETYEDTALVTKDPVGVVACITPWNYPLNQIQRKLTPALLAGNTVVVKPASFTPLTALAFAKIFDDAGIPKGVVNFVTGSGSTVGDYLAKHEDVNCISFTGSTEVGAGLYEAAGPTIKRLVLELGGKSAMVYLEGGDLDYAIDKTMGTVYNNQGQTCTALTRLLVPESMLEEVEEKLLAYYQDHIVIGDPADPKTTVGPMVSQAQKDIVLDYIDKGKAAGAKLLVGGKGVDGPGYFVEPTIFTHVTNDMTIAREEIFGPVLCVITYKTVEEAVQIANDSDYGLSGAVVGPKDKAKKVALQLKTGNVFVNDGPRSAKAPFGGFKQSGLGRENGLYGIDDYVELKAVFL
ncbi:aldehyde dehydrogenase family protein [Eremococcus coleocola]|uniref:aldehyde dehydrogenase (NAD(+)) n=1 Tax=Eremococcus coleocola ACS-139-V-Col8 TaxID=908337 RepID=E4KRC5_9LACT|nr:aldehyde dehydrogenase family protein [Eremococcus coleocola]EFR30473.1 aldehyde dehydrogenase (NAD) family protein [Eremococcus coleocola ACS-139-V-Col8]